MPDETENNDFGNETDGEVVEQVQPGQAPTGPIRVRTPRGKEVIGKVMQRLGANRMDVACFDGKTRNCRVPGRLKRALWIRPGNIVLVEPWEFEGDKKGDIIFSYTPAAIDWLAKRGYIKGISNEF